jgi:asparagine synthase (glutamine-hydrolysing)
MCGICGIVAFSPGFCCDATIIQKMSEVLRHRGPDDGGTWVDEQRRAALGHRRLSIVDLSAAGRQPMTNEDGSLWITFNGEIYNHADLRPGLERNGHHYASRTDTETLLHLYEERGPSCLELLQGMFAFAIYDTRAQSLFLARDRVGIKPLYYTQTADGFLFGSEIKALLAHPLVHRELDQEAMWHYLTYAFVPPPRTMFAGISKLPPASWMTVRSDGSTEIGAWWEPISPGLTEELRAVSSSIAASRLRELLAEAVRKRMMADVPFGVFLSGGLDSSTNAALMALSATGPVRTISAAPDNHGRYDETGYATAVAEHLGTDHHEIRFSEADLHEVMDEIAYFQDEPLADWTAVPQWHLARAARDTGTIVVHTGEGADEVFYGYRGYQLHRRVLVPFQRMPRSARRVVAETASALSSRTGRGARHSDALMSGTDSPIPFWGGNICFRGAAKARLAPSNGRFGNSLSIAEDNWRESEERGAADVFQKMAYVEVKQRLSGLLLARVDRMTMAHGVEARVPFLDHAVIEFALALPPRLKWHQGQGKWLLRQVARDLLPSAIVHRGKQGFGTPMAEWLAGDFGRVAEAEVLRSAFTDATHLDRAALKAIWDEHRVGRGDWARQLWVLYSAAAWYDRWLSPA